MLVKGGPDVITLTTQNQQLHRNQGIAYYLTYLTPFFNDCDIICMLQITWFMCPFVVMMTSSNGNIFRVTGHLCREFTGPWWIPHTKASDAELWCFFDLHLKKQLSKQPWSWWFETLSCPLCRHRNGQVSKAAADGGCLFGLPVHIRSATLKWVSNELQNRNVYEIHQVE